jgi:hypothetical protein
MSVVFSENWKMARQITHTTNIRCKRELSIAGVLSCRGMTGKYPLPRATKDFCFTPSGKSERPHRFSPAWPLNLKPFPA